MSNSAPSGALSPSLSRRVGRFACVREIRRFRGGESYNRNPRRRISRPLIIQTAEVRNAAWVSRDLELRAQFPDLRTYSLMRCIPINDRPAPPTPTHHH